MMTTDLDEVGQTIQKLADMVAEGTPSFQELVRTAGMDPASDFAGRDLSHLDFRDEDLSGFNFTGADLSGCDFRRSNISGVKFEGSRRYGAIGLPDLEPRTPGGIVRCVTICNRRGFDARPAAKFVTLASVQPTEITVAKFVDRAGHAEGFVTGTSIMGLMMLGAAMGDVIRLEASGPGAEEALDAMIELVAARFGEVE